VAISGKLRLEPGLTRDDGVRLFTKKHRPSIKPLPETWVRRTSSRSRRTIPNYEPHCSFPVTAFGELVVTGRRQMAARADCGRTLARSHGRFDTLLVDTEVGVLVDKTSETMAAV
jgi:hypothetical protein